MKAIVLTAGTGSRLGPITSQSTKGMVKVKQKRLIDYLLDFLDPSFFDEIIVVGGFAFQELKDHLARQKISNLKILENKDYLKGNIYTLLKGLEEIDNNSFLITNVDHIYPPKMFKEMSKHFSQITAMCDFDRSLGQDDMKVKLKEDGQKIKKISKQLTDFEAGYIGMTYVDQASLYFYKEALEKTLSLYGDKAVVENILQVLAEDENLAPKICDLSGFGWYEVDDQADLEKTEAGLIKDPNFN